MQKTTVGFIGLGLMGNPMAKNILKKGFPLVVYNRTPKKTKELEKLGALAVKSPADMALKSDVIVTMVTAGKDVENVLFGKDGVVKGARPGLVVIDMSTIGVQSALLISEKLKSHGIEFLDAPVTGSTPKAITGELTIFIGGEKKVFERVKNVLSAMGTNLQYMGKTGNGQAIKLIANHILAASVIALAEGMVLADAMKLPREKIGNVLKTLPAMSPFMNLKLPNYIKNDYPLLFSAANLKKDLSLALVEAKKGKKNLSLLNTTEKLYKKALKEKLGNEDMSTIVKVIT